MTLVVSKSWQEDLLRQLSASVVRCCLILTLASMVDIQDAEFIIFATPVSK